MFNYFFSMYFFGRNARVIRSIQSPARHPSAEPLCVVVVAKKERPDEIRAAAGWVFWGAGRLSLVAVEPKLSHIHTHRLARFGGRPPVRSVRRRNGSASTLPAVGQVGIACQFERNFRTMPATRDTHNNVRFVGFRKNVFSTINTVVTKLLRPESVDAAVVMDS